MRRYRQIRRADQSRCVCYFFYDDMAMGTHITLSQLYAAAPEFSFPRGDKPANQPALSQTLVGHSIIVIRHYYQHSLVSKLYSGAFRNYTCLYR